MSSKWIVVTPKNSGKVYKKLVDSGKAMWKLTVINSEEFENKYVAISIAYDNSNKVLYTISLDNIDSIEEAKSKIESACIHLTKNIVYIDWR